MILPCCANSVCAACIQSWLGRTSECPICRESLGEEQRNCAGWVRNRQLEALCDNIRTARYNEAKERQSLGVIRGLSSSSTTAPVASDKSPADKSQCKCIICFDHHAPQLGISCSSRTTEPHFICKSCFPPLVLSLCHDQSKLLDHGFEIRCPYPECPSNPFDCSVVTSMLLRDHDSTEASVQGKSVIECTGAEAARVGRTKSKAVSRTRARTKDTTVRSRKDSGEVPLSVLTSTTLAFDEANGELPQSEALGPDLEVDGEHELEAELEAKLEAGSTPPQKVVLDQYISALVSAATRSSLKHRMHRMHRADWHLGPSIVGDGNDGGGSGGGSSGGGGGGGANHGNNSRSQSPGFNDFGSGAGSSSAFSLTSSPLTLAATAAGPRSSFAPYDMDRLCQLVEENLNAQCPASFCRAVLDQSPDGCCAMRCTQCGTHFCWLCGAISPCSGSTHSHVRRCIESPQPGSVFLPQRDVDAALRQQRLMALRRALGTTIGPRWAADSRLRRLVRENGRLVGALKDCGISVADLFDSLIISAQQRLAGAAAGGGAGAGAGGAGGEGGLANPGGWLGLRAIFWGGARGDGRHAAGAGRGLWLDGRAVAVVVAISCLVQYAGLDVFGFFGRVFGRVASGSTALAFALLQRVCEWTAQRGAAVSLRLAQGVVNYGPVVFTTIFDLAWASLWAVGVASWVVFVHTVKAIWLFLGLVNNVIR